MDPNYLTQSSKWTDKTIAKVVEDCYSSILLLFTDGTYAKISKEVDPYDRDSVSLSTSEVLSLEEQRDLGLVADKEYRAIQKERARKAQEENLAWQRRTYEQLKKQFEKT